MRTYRRRTSLLLLLACIASALAAPAAHAYKAKIWEAGTCVQEGCEYSSPTSSFYTKAAGHPPWGITSFELETTGSGTSRKPVEQLKRLRVDVPPGLAADPEALPSCSRATFDSNPSSCAAAKVGKTEVVAALEIPIVGVVDTTLTGTVYNLGQEPGLPLLFGIAIEPTGGVLISAVHLLLEGHVSDAYEPGPASREVPTGNYHEWFEINNVPREAEAEVLGVFSDSAKLSLIKSKLFFEGQKGGNFLTLPSVCSSTTTSYLEVEFYGGASETRPTHTPVGVEECGKVPFKPTTEIRPQTSQYDEPDGTVAEVKVPQHEGATEINTADIEEARVKLPEGLTLNPSAAHGLQACTPAEVHFGEATPPSCPAASRIGTDTIETDLPPGSLSGGVYLGAPSGTPITGPPYTVYLTAESIYGVFVKIEGKVVTNESNGRLEATFANSASHPYNAPQLPFSDLVLALNNGPRASLANPLGCGVGQTESLFGAYSGEGISKLFEAATPFSATGCPTTIPFGLGQSTSETSSRARDFTDFTFNLTRGNGQQYISTVSTALPPGLVGMIPSVTRCVEPAAASGSCPATSQIGSATALAGSGSEPYAVSGPVYLTGPTGGAPYGLSIPVEAAAGPFDLGRVTTRVALSVEPHTGRVIATAALPTIQRGVPLRLRQLTVVVARPSFLFNPTNCGALATESTVASTMGALDRSSSPFQATDCGALAFKPVLRASSPSTPSRANGASLDVTVSQPPGQANIRSVVAQLPEQLPSRQTTLKKACAQATFVANPLDCPKESRVGSASVTTPVLPEKLTGPAYLVSHGNAQLPNLEVILEGDGGVKVVLESRTTIRNSVTTSTFESLPDVPISHFELNLPVGPYSALGSYGSFCARPLYMPTTIVAQNGAQLKEKIRLSIGSCKIKLLSHRVKGHELIVKVQTFTAGRISVTSPSLHTTYKRVSGPTIATIKVALSKRGSAKLAADGTMRVRFRVGFNPAHKGEYHSARFASATFR